VILTPGGRRPALRVIEETPSRGVRPRERPPGIGDRRPLPSSSKRPRRFVDDKTNAATQRRPRRCGVIICVRAPVTEILHRRDFTAERRPSHGLLICPGCAHAKQITVGRYLSACIQSTVATDVGKRNGR